MGYPTRRGEIGQHGWLLRRRLWHEVDEVAHLVSGVLLDVGCGAKPYAPLFTNVRHIGLDLPTSLDGRSRADIFGSATALPFRDASFDAILCTQVLDSIATPLDVLREFVRILQPGGVCIVSVNKLYPVHDPPHDYLRFTEYGLAHILRLAGLDLISVRTMGGSWMTVGILITQRTWALHMRLPLLRRLRAIPAIAGVCVLLFFELLDHADPHPDGGPNLIAVARK
jgi:SAM-dependent methyltransferase